MNIMYIHIPPLFYFCNPIKMQNSSRTTASTHDMAISDPIKTTNSVVDSIKLLY